LGDKLKKSGIRFALFTGVLVLLLVSMSSLVSADIFINEILPHSEPNTQGEWIELFNNDSSSVDLTQFNISETGSANFTINSSIPANGFIVLANDFATFNSTHPDINLSGIRIVNITESFNLRDERGNVSLYNSSGDLIDVVLYTQKTGEDFENISFGRIPDGSSNFFNLSVLTPGDNNDNAAPTLNKWVNPSGNNSFISGLFNITVNITDAAHPVNVSIMEFNNSNTTMDRSGDLFYSVLNTSLYDEILYNNITIYFNDSVGLSNTDTLFNVTVDNTNPSILAPGTTANARNFIDGGSIFNATVVTTDDNLFNVSCSLSGTTVGNFSVDGNTHKCNLTAPATEGDFEISFTAVDKAGNTNTTTHNFTTNNATTGSLSSETVTVLGLNQSDKVFGVNVTLENTGNNPMYDAGVILQTFSADENFEVVNSTYESCSLNLSSGQSCTILFNVTVDGGITGSHSIFWNRNWTNADFTEVTFATTFASTITITDSSQITATTNITATVNHGENSTISLDVNSTGNADLAGATVTFIPDTAKSSWLNITSFSFGTISAKTNETLDINIEIPKSTNPSNYTGTLNITGTSAEHRAVLLTIDVPNDDSWIVSPNETITHKRSNAAGLLGKFTINNTGNVGHNFTFPRVGNFNTFPNLWNYSNVDNIYVESGKTGTVSIYHQPMNGNTPKSFGSFNLTFTVTSENTSQINTTFMSLVRDDNSPFANVTSPLNNSFVTGIVDFNVSAANLNLSNIEFYINDNLVFNDREINASFKWNTNDGNYLDAAYTLKAIVFDTAGNSNFSNINVTVNNTDDDPIFVVDIPAITIIEDNDSTVLNLSSYFKSLDGEIFDGIDFQYNFTQPDNVTVHINNATQIVNFTPFANFTGLNNITFTAIDSSSNTTSSNFIIIDVTNVNDAPTEPVLTDPEDGSNVTSSAGLATLVWDASVDIEDSSITYYLFISNDSNDIRFNATTTSANLQLTGLDANTTYFWNVLASDGPLNSSNSSIFNFTMFRDNNPVIDNWSWNNTINVSSTNVTPFVAENNFLNFTINVSDEDDDPINFTWYIDNEEESNVQNFTFDLENNFTAVGSYVIKLVVQDNNSNSDEQQWTVTVTNTNRDPVMDSIGNKDNAVEDAPFKFNITVNDPDNDTTLTFTSNYSSVVNPITFVRDSNNSLATISWIPNNDNVGSNVMTFTANDSLESALETITITVANTNDAPTISSSLPLDNKTIAEGSGVQRFDVTFVDVDIADYTNATWFRNTTNVIGINTSNVSVTGLSEGLYNITVIVNDTSGLEARNEWTLTVTTGLIEDGLTSTITNLNQSERENVTNVRINESTFGGIDFGNKSMNFSRVANLEDVFNISEGFISVNTQDFPELNKNASLVMKGLSFTKAPLIFKALGFESNSSDEVCAEDVCTNVTYDVANGILRFNVLNFSTYFTQTNRTNEAPIVTSTPDITAVENAVYSYDVDATDADGDTLIFSFIVDSSPTGMSIDSSSGLITWTPTTVQIGLNNVSVNISDSNLTVLQDFNITVVEGPKLFIKDIDVKVNGDTDKNLEDGDKINDEAKPGSKVVFDIEVENLFTDEQDLKIKDITVEITIEDIDDGGDLDEESDEFDIKPGKDENVDIRFEIPYDVEEGTYDVIIFAEGEDENNTNHETTVNLQLEVDKDSHEIQIIRSVLSPKTISCQRQISLSTEIVNTGSSDEDEVSLEVFSGILGINSIEEEIELDEGVDDNRFSKLFTESINMDVSVGTYPITINTYYDGRLSETETVNLDVTDCVSVRSVKKKVAEEKPNVEVILPKSLAEEKPDAEVSFSGTEGYNVLMIILLIILIGTGIFVVGAGIILLKK
jgi:hypothetical protein